MITMHRNHIIIAINWPIASYICAETISKCKYMINFPGYNAEDYRMFAIAKCHAYHVYCALQDNV